ncbi:MAG TPA: YcaO-like family protein, partial [Catenuloplanes sp.]
DRRGPAFLNVFRAGAPQAYGARRVTGLRAAQLMENGGKGTTAQQGEASALCEALERHCGTWRGDEERIRADYRSVADTAIHPDTCQLYHDRQFADRGQWNARNSPFQFVCDPFDETAELDWSPVWSVTEQRHRLLPTGLLYYRAPAAADRTFVRAHSSGNAAGSDLTDAVLRGVLELVERDCVALWWYNRTRHPGLDLAAFGNPWLAELREVYRGLRREVWALDVTSDLGVPTVVALSRRIDKPAEDIMFGFGSHPDPATALISACTEMNQLMPALVDVDADGGYGVTDPDAVRWWTTATVGAQPHLLPDPDRPLRGPGDFGPAATADTLGQLDGIRRGIEGQGMHLLVLDQTRPDIGLPVVKVIVPGLRHMWARYAPGRLYDVPVRQGLLAEPTPYEQLNPIPLFV